MQRAATGFLSSIQRVWLYDAQRVTNASRTDDSNKYLTGMSRFEMNDMRQSRREFQGDSSAAVEEIDPRVMAVSPGEPYEQLLPGTLIQAGDIKRLVPEQHWVPAEDHDVGYEVPRSGLAFARVKVPTGCELCTGVEYPTTDLLVWTDGTQSWGPVGITPAADNAPQQWLLTLQNDAASLKQVSIRKENTIAEICAAWTQIFNQRAFFAKPLGQSGIPHTMLPVPAEHRLMHAIERFRPGDKQVREGENTWRLVDPSLHGQPVGASDGTNGFRRCCRPVGPFAMNWYIDPVTGNEAFLGGPDDPWPSLEVAQRKIDAAFKATGRLAVGTLWQQGSIRMYYDFPVDQIPEKYLQELDAQPQEAAPAPAPAPAAPIAEAVAPMEEFAPLQPGGMVGVGLGGMSEEELVRKAAELHAQRQQQSSIDPAMLEKFKNLQLVLGAQTPATHPRSKEALQQMPSGFELVPAVTYARTKDLLYRPSWEGEDAPWTWQVARDVDTKKPVGDVLVARRIVSADNRALAALKDVQQQLLQLTETVNRTIDSFK